MSAMDGERQPLISRRAADSRFRNYRPLNYEEVLAARDEAPWRRARLGLLLVFWAAMAVFLSLIVSLITRHRCPEADMGPVPAVPPVHMSFTPLIS